LLDQILENFRALLLRSGKRTESGEPDLMRRFQHRFRQGFGLFGRLRAEIGSRFFQHTDSPWRFGDAPTIVVL